jgi:hypothetical protein
LRSLLYVEDNPANLKLMEQLVLYPAPPLGGRVRTFGWPESPV